MKVPPLFTCFLNNSLVSKHSPKPKFFFFFPKNYELMYFTIIDVFQLIAAVILFAAGSVRRQEPYPLFEKI